MSAVPDPRRTFRELANRLEAGPDGTTGEIARGVYGSPGIAWLSLVDPGACSVGVFENVRGRMVSRGIRGAGDAVLPGPLAEAVPVDAFFP